MQVQAELSVYPLRTETMSEGILAFKGVLEAYGLETRMGTMSTFVSGEAGDVFAACGEAFEKTGQAYSLAVVLKVCNACPPAEKRG